MATISKVFLSESTNGRQIKVTDTSSPGTLIHTAVEGVDDIDEIWLEATNTSSSDVELVLQWGGTTSPDDYSYFTVPAKDSFYWVARGRLLQNELNVRAFAGSANVINITGFVNRISV